MELGFIGTGKMGRPMVLRLLDAGYSVFVYNRTAKKLQDLAKAGAVIADSPVELAKAVDMILLCLTDGFAVEQLVFSEQGVAKSGPAKKLVIDLSSIAPHDTLRIARRLQQETGMRWIDAPVSGGVVGAQEGTLAIMCGGEEVDVEDARPVLQHLARNVTHMGGSGSGQVTKLCNQAIVSSNVAVIAEAINLAKCAGINAARLPEALQGGFADSLPLQIYGPRMAAEHEAEPIGEIQTMLKDATNALDYTKSVNANLPMTSRAVEIYQLVADKGFLHGDLENLMRQFEPG